MRWKIGLAATAVAIGSMLYWALRVYTPAIADSPGKPGVSIASLEQVRLSGDSQWILVRGQNRHAPIVLFLHGGPGMPMMYLAYAFQRPLEKRFLTVQWDRRGAGKTFSVDSNVAKMRVSQEMADTIELMGALRARFGTGKIILVGHSYGSMLGIRVAQARPDLVRAYVGVGQQACDQPAELKLQDIWIASHARLRGDARTLALATSGKRYDREPYLFRYGGELVRSTSFLDLVWIGLRAPEYSLLDAYNVKRGVDFTHLYLKDDVSKGALMDDVTHLAVPVYFFEGKMDYTAPSACAQRYFDRLEAPIKRLVWFGHSAHFPFLEEPQNFATALEQVAAETKTRAD